MKRNFLSWIGIAVAFGTWTPAWAAPAQILIIRHAEKPEPEDSPDLSPEGYAHAQALVGYFRSSPDVLQFGPPAAIYAMAPHGPGGTERPIETVTPLAQALGLPLQTAYTRLQYQPLISDILSHPEYDGKMVLVCWEHKAIRGLAAAIGVSPEPPEWQGSDFSTVYRIDLTPEGKVASFDTVTQALGKP